METPAFTDRPSPTRGLFVRRVALSQIQLDPANARRHNERNLDAIRASLTRFGQAEPLVVQSGTLRLIAGHGRLEAMQTLGWKEADIVELEVTNLDATSLAIALNRTAELADWDDIALAKLLHELSAEDALEGLGFDDQELDLLLANLEAETRGPLEDAGPDEPRELVVSCRGDLWHLGEHRLLCGDATSAEDMRRLFDGEQPKLLSTDPPFSVNYTGKDRPINDGKSSGKDWTCVYREVDLKDLEAFFDGVFGATVPHLADGAAIYIWHAHVQQPMVAAAFERHGLLLHQILVWVKPTATFGHSYYHWRHEPCAFGWKKGKKPRHGVGQLDSVWAVDWEGKARVVGNEHPMQKPLRLFEIPMEQHTKPGDIVVDPFSGSGSQLIAAQRLGRRCFAMEISPTFVDVAIRRWQKTTGEQATLDGTGESYAELEIERLKGAK